MRFTVQKEAILNPLKLAAGVVEKNQTYPVLSNVLLHVEDNRLAITASDLEVEMIVNLLVMDCDGGKITVPARKFSDICNALPENAIIEFTLDNERVIVRSGRSRFVFSTLPAIDFPNIESITSAAQFTVQQRVLKRLIERTYFAMAQQDVRYYLNGLLFEIGEGELRCVATDGHRLALCEIRSKIDIDEMQQVIIPRKGVLELVRLLDDTEELVTVQLGNNHIRVTTSDISFTSKLVDGHFPEYQRVVPEGGDKIIIVDRELLRHALLRASILSNERYRSVRFQVTAGSLEIIANNPEREEAEEHIEVDYDGDDLEIGFNASYILDAVTAVEESNVKLILTGSNSCCLIEGVDNSEAKYVVMPMRI